MALLILYGLILLGFSMTSRTFVSSSGSIIPVDEYPITSASKKCEYFKQNSLLTSVCKNRGLEELPGTLRSDIEVLDFSINRLTEIKNNTFVKFSNLKFLDLSDNFLQIIEEGAFESLQNLKALDLTKTRSSTITKSIFRLPNLERLFLENNRLTDSVLEVNVTAPIAVLKAPKNLLKKIPQFGPFPTMVYLNLSQNFISEISVTDIAPYCRLLTLDISNNPIKFDSATCDCQAFKIWTKEHNMTVKADFNCSVNPYHDCSSIKFSNATRSLFEQCEEVIRVSIEIEKAKSTWILVVSCIAGFLIVVLFILYCIHLRNKKRHKKLKKEQNAININTELLNGNAQEQT